MNYTLHQLQVFLEVIRSRSITKAAEKLHLTQPAVSIQIKNLQDQFEIPIIEIVGRKVFITDFGKEIAAAAAKILEEVNVINSKAAAYRGQLIGALKITVVSTGKYVIPYFLSSFIKQQQGIELVLDVTNRAKVLESLERNEVDFALVSILPSQLKLESIELMENKLYLVGSRNNSLKKKTIQDRAVLNEIPMIFREEGSGTRQVMERFIKQHQLKVIKKMELTSNEAVKQAVIAGLGYSVMPLIGMRNALKQGDLQIIPVEGFPINSLWHLVWLKSKKLSPVAAAFKDYIQENKGNIIKENFEDVAEKKKD